MGKGLPVDPFFAPLSILWHQPHEVLLPPTKRLRRALRPNHFTNLTLVAIFLESIVGLILLRWHLARRSSLADAASPAFPTERASRRQQHDTGRSHSWSLSKPPLPCKCVLGEPRYRVKMLFPTVTVDRLGAVIGMHALYQWR